MTSELLKIKNLNEVSSELIMKLNNSKIYFGHQSVGYNIINGVKEIQKNNDDLNINIVETKDQEEIQGRGFYHSTVGENFNLKSKVDDFVKIMKSGVAQKVNVAFFKFCYVDIESHSDIQDIFEYYTKAMKELESKYPQTTFIHVTVPLFTKPSLIKSIIKKILGRPDHNIKRNLYNDMLRKKYDSSKIFDIAACESTYPDGKREFSGDYIYALIPEYTDDGGHLFGNGAEHIASQLLAFLAETIK